MKCKENGLRQVDEGSRGQACQGLKRPDDIQVKRKFCGHFRLLKNQADVEAQDQRQASQNVCAKESLVTKEVDGWESRFWTNALGQV